MSNESSNNQHPQQVPQSQEPQEHVLSLSTRRLQSFSPPDLEVLVGPKQRIYRYHALILAGHSAYVDTILSSPLAIQNQEKKRINFPDISEETWERMISYLEPGSLHFLKLDVSDLEEVLHYFDKYQFVDGVHLCDSLIAKFMGNDVSSRYHPEVYRPERFVSIAVMAYSLNLPKSKKVAVAWAEEVLEKMTPNEESTVKQLLPLVENNEKVLMSMASTIMGRHAVNMTVDEMREMTKADSFPSDVILKTKQIKELEEHSTKIMVEELRIEVTGVDHDGIGARYERCHGRWLAVNAAYGLKHRGAMECSFTKKNLYYVDDETEQESIVIDAMDPFGLKWEIVSIPEETVDEPQPRRRVLHRWDCGYSILVPPKYGWKKVEGRSTISEIQYSLSS